MIVSAEMHYARIPRAYWQARLKMAYAMGCNAMSTYVFWNIHEPSPGAFDFEGENDVAAYVLEAARCGLDVILRPGPYVCAEWDFGGLPAWLLDGREISIRTAAESYMAPVRTWLSRLGEELAPLQRSRGGPIVAVQLENEYGAFGNDRVYLEAMRDALDAAGFGDSPYFTIDQPQHLARGSLEGVPVAATFGPGNAQRDLGAIRALRPGAPLWCGEYWAGWFDHWGDPHERRDDALQAQELVWMLSQDAAVNIYMFHGGTNFGFNNGANADDERSYKPTTTSYDYLAALDEAGRPTSKYFAFREAIAAGTKIAPRPVPPAPRTIDVAPFELQLSAPVEDLLGKPVQTQHPRSMEVFGQSFGYTLYRTTLPLAGEGTLDFELVRDFITVSIDGVVVGRLDRRTNETSLACTVPRAGATLDVLVENCGRVNYGPLVPGERKGLVAPVRFNGAELLDWTVAPLDFANIWNAGFGYESRPGPALYRGRFALDRRDLADTFFDLSSLQKGVLFVNGRNAGRYWNAGPQRSLYVPGAWLRPVNEIVAFDVYGAEHAFIRGTREPIIDP